VPTRRLVRALIDASRRGVDVRLALPGISDTWAPLAAGRSTYGRLLQAGVRIYERHNAILHAKTAVIDGAWSPLAPATWTGAACSTMPKRTSSLSTPNSPRASRPSCGRHRASEELTLERWMRRGWTARLVEWLAQRLEFCSSVARLVDVQLLRRGRAKRREVADMPS
jgi:cardiolipin synthase